MDLIPSAFSNNTLESYLSKISVRSRIIYWIILGIVITGIGLLPFIYVDVSVQARGFFQSDIEKQVLYTPAQGKITYISVRNGDSIKKGDTLLVIDSDAVIAHKSAVQHEIAVNDSSIRDLEILTKIDSINNPVTTTDLITERYRAEFANIINQQMMQLQKFQKKKTEHIRNELLFNMEIIPEIEYENSMFQVNTEKEYLNQILVHQKSVWHNDLAERKNDKVRLLADFEQCTTEFNNRILLAPANGEIIQSADIQTGSIVSQGQKVAEISPDGELIATCYVKPADIGLIHENQQVKLQVDAFNYNEWGMLNGDIIDISDDLIIEDGSTAYFKVKCKPAGDFLALKNGYQARMKKGMTLTARIIVIRRSIYNLLFDKANKWFNPYIYNRE